MNHSAYSPILADRASRHAATPLPQNHRRRPGTASPAFCLVALIGLAGAAASHAAPAFTGSSKAYGIRSTLSIASLNLLNPAPVGVAEGSAPAAYAVQQSAVPIDLNLSRLLVVDLLKATGVCSSTAASDIGGAAPVKSASAASSVEGLKLSVASLLLVPPIVSIEADALQANSAILADANGSLTSSGGSQLANLKLKVLNIPVTLTTGANPAPNTEIDLALSGLVGARLVLNERTVTTNADGRLRVTGNALSLHFNAVNVVGVGLLNGSVEVGHHESLITVDLDGDGVSDPEDNDDDGDGIPDTTEGGGSVDTDGDGIPDSRDPDSDNDGIPDAVEGAADPDNDSIPNYRDLDSDGDGIPDALEGTDDPDNDGKSNFLDLDSDGDNLHDAVEGAADPDGDGRGNFTDLDSDGDGIPDYLEGTGDPDRDGVPNFLDLDSDGDGINDVRENGSIDRNGDGMMDDLRDEDRNGISDSVPVPPVARDSDRDLVPDFLDLDSDNDTISDLQEGGAPGTDSNNDGILDDGDSDGDGITNAADGKVGFGDANDPAPRNTDGDELPDYLDPDSDNSGSPDIASAGNAALDADGDGRVDALADTDGDGVPQVVDRQPAAAGGLPALITYGQWVKTHFQPAEQADPAISGPAADPDGDTSPNLLEFTFGTLPKNARSVVFPQFLTEDTPLGRFSQLSVPKAAGIYAFVGVEVSEGMSQAPSWDYRPDLVDIASETGVSLVVRSLINPATTPRLFLRVRSRLP